MSIPYKHVTNTELRERFREIGFWAPSGTAKQMDAWLDRVAIALFNGETLLVDSRNPNPSAQKWAMIAGWACWTNRIAVECGQPSLL
jgi:hypothetical protein